MSSAERVVMTPVLRPVDGVSAGATIRAVGRRGPTVADVVRSMLGDDLPVALEAYDGSRLGPDGARTRIVVRAPDALRRIVAAPGELGLSRAYVAGDIDVEGDVF